MGLKKDPREAFCTKLRNAKLGLDQGWALAMAIHLSLRVAPLDLQQGGNSRIPYVHVPAARMSILVYIATAINTFFFLLTKHPLFLRSSGTGTEMGAFFTLFTLVTGGFRGRPMWGTFWVWDARLTSVFISFLIYLGALRFQKLPVEPASISIRAGPIDIPIIKSSVNWWNTSHQPGSISRSGTSIHVPMPIPILSNFANSPFSTRILFVLETRLPIPSFPESPLTEEIEAREGIPKPSSLADTYVAFVLSIQYPIPGRIYSIQPIPCCLLHPALVVIDRVPYLESGIEFVSASVPLAVEALLSHDTISRPHRLALSPKPHNIHIPSTKYSLPAQMHQFAYLYPFPRIESFSISFFGCPLGKSPLFKHDFSHPPSSDTPEYPLFLTLSVNYLMARDLHYQVSMDSLNKTYGVELYSPHFVVSCLVTKDFHTWWSGYAAKVFHKPVIEVLEGFSFEKNLEKKESSQPTTSKGKASEKNATPEVVEITSEEGGSEVGEKPSTSAIVEEPMIEEPGVEQESQSPDDGILKDEGGK
ncbi:hypothetical protein FEM48_ZijujUnG0012000 [Ziziphus jujuba var. spinosa]|uniref:Cytochrome c assembly protein domain-containing protein n=1 Tax=Ziziphus jujuba var. spinosa TaxID=714518 RepID=A0A978U9X0_ZIZJJ|nr:hypothetical protein FEM48_ZijujUnG0012000 [Ziziphus jujuba var. spinosa]